MGWTHRHRTGIVAVCVLGNLWAGAAVVGVSPLYAAALVCGSAIALLPLVPVPADHRTRLLQNGENS
jgi:hypothetical protein